MIRNRFILRLKRYHQDSGRRCSQSQGNRKASGSGGSMDASLKLEGIDAQEEFSFLVNILVLLGISLTGEEE